MILLFLLIIPVTALTVILIIAWKRPNAKTRILEKLLHENLEHLRVQYLMSQTSNFVATGGNYITVDMYFNKDLIFICPLRKGLFNGLFNFYLPVIYTLDFNKAFKITGFNNIIVPTEVKLTDWNALIIKYHRTLIGNVNGSIQIKPIDKSDISKITTVGTYFKK